MTGLVPSDSERLILRRLGVGDIDLVTALEAEIFAEDPWTSAMVGEELRAPGRHYVAALLDDTVVGYAGIAIGSDADVMTIGVRMSARGRGVGTFLLAELLRAAREAGAQRVFLEVRASNGSAIGLYARAGFTRIGRVRRYFRNPVEDAVTMRADLRRESARPGHSL